MNIDDKKKFLINSTYITFCAVIFYLIFKLATVYLLPFFIGVLIAYFVQKPAAALEKKFKIRKNICASVLSVFFYIVTIIAVVFILIFLYRLSNGLMTSFINNGEFIKNFQQKFDHIFWKIEAINVNTFKIFVDETFNGFISKLGNILSNSIAVFVKKIPALIFSSIVTVVATCYIAKDFDCLKSFFKGFLQEGTYTKLIKIKVSFVECFLKFSVGYFWMFIITFLELVLGLLILGVPKFFVIALLITFFDLLPVFGTGGVLLPWSIISFLQSNYKNGTGLIMIYLAIIIVRNFLEPKIIGKQIGINPIFTLLFVFLGLRLAGIVGMITFPIILTVLFNYYRKEYTC